VEEVYQFVVTSAEPGSGRTVLEPAHWLVSAVDTAMILFDPVVEITIGSMEHTLAEFGPDRPPVTARPIPSRMLDRQRGVLFRSSASLTV
jgi:hypothetical protein